MDQLPSSATMFCKFEAAIAVYGVPNSRHNILSREAAEQLAEQVKNKISPVQGNSARYRITSTRLER